MTNAVAGEERERAVRWVDEGRSVLDALPGILNDYDRLKQALEAAENECERLRQEVARLHAETDRHQREREEIAESIARFMDESLGRLRVQHQQA